MWLLIALIAVPLVEIALFIRVGGWIGLWPTIGFVVLTAMIGAFMLRRQGVSTMRKLQVALERGEDPSAQLAHGGLVLFAGALLLTPGFFTDAVGFALLTERARAALIEWLRPRLARRVIHSTTAYRRGGFATEGRPRGHPGDDAAIDVEYRDLTDAEAGPREDDDRRRDPGR